jgi:hypothetical protein
MHTAKSRFEHDTLMNVAEEASQNSTRNVEQNNKQDETWKKPWMWTVIAAMIAVITVTVLTGTYFFQRRHSKIQCQLQGMMIHTTWHQITELVNKQAREVIPSEYVSFTLFRKKRTKKTVTKSNYGFQPHN